jgi:hypothetical protein
MWLCGLRSVQAETPFSEASIASVLQSSPTSIGVRRLGGHEHGRDRDDDEANATSRATDWRRIAAALPAPRREEP